MGIQNERERDDDSGPKLGNFPRLASSINIPGPDWPTSLVYVIRVNIGVHNSG
jgi:hypothetical protein